MGTAWRRALALLATVGLVLGLQVAPAQAADGLGYAQYREFEVAIARDVDAYWTQTSADRAVDYVSAALARAGRGESTVSGCGAVAADPAEAEQAGVSPAFYCPLDGTVYLASGWMYREIYRGFGDFAAAAVIAHEWAHHAQAASGTTNRGTKQSELQADCWAGTWARHVDARLDPGDLDEAGAALFAAGDREYASPQHHGTPEERRAWFQQGYRSGDPGDCNP